MGRKEDGDDRGREGEGDAGDEDAPVDAGDHSPVVTRDELRAYLSLRATLARARAVIAKRVQGQDVDDLVSVAVEHAMAVPDDALPRRASIVAWFDRVCARRVADHHRKRARRAKYEGDIPAPAVQRDEAGEPVGDPDEAAADPRVDPREPDWRAEGWLLRGWMREQVAGDANDEQTWAIMEELADDEAGLTYKQLAARHGMSEAQLYKRVQRLKDKYRERFEKWRNGAILAWIKWGIVVAAVVAGVAWIIWRWLGPDIRRDPDENRPPRPVPTLSAAPSDTPFEPALPPSPPSPPPQEPKPGDKPR